MAQADVDDNGSATQLSNRSFITEQWAGLKGVFHSSIAVGHHPVGQSQPRRESRSVYSGRAWCHENGARGVLDRAECDEPELAGRIDRGTADDDQIGLDILGDELMWVCPQQPAHNSHRGPRLRKQARPGREHGASSRESCVDTQAPLAKRHGHRVHEQECLIQCGGTACDIGEHLDVVGQLLECGDDAGSDRPRPRRTIDQDSGTASG